LKAPVLKTGTLSKPTKIASKILGFPGLPSPLSRLNRANSGHKNVYSERRFAVPFPQRFSESFPYLTSRGNSSERCLKFAGNHSPRNPQNLHSSIHRSDEGQSRSSLPQSFTPLGRTTRRLNVVCALRNCFSEFFRFSESPEPDLVWLNQALGQQLGPAESSRDNNRAGPFVTEEGLQGRSHDRNDVERTGMYQFIEFRVLNSRGSCTPIVPERREITKPYGSHGDDGIGPFDGHKPGSERNSGTPTFCSHRDCLISSRSSYCSDRSELPLRLQKRGRNDTADVSTSVYKQSEFFW
jgi:hypothetical protein